MNQVDIILARCKIGQTIIDKLMTLKDAQIKAIIRKSVNEHLHALVWEGTVIRTIQDEIVQSIEICYHARIQVCANGIYYTPEHGDRKSILLFGDDYITNGLKQDLGIQ